MPALIRGLLEVVLRRPWARFPLRQGGGPPEPKPLHPHDPEGGAAQYGTSTPCLRPLRRRGGDHRPNGEHRRRRGDPAGIRPKAEAMKASLDAIPGVLRPLTAPRLPCRDRAPRHRRRRWRSTTLVRSCSGRLNLIDRSGVRVSVALYTSDAELEVLVEAVRVLAGRRGTVDNEPVGNNSPVIPKKGKIAI